MANSDASRYGRHYYCVGLYDDRELYVFADDVVFHENGDLILYGRHAPEKGQEPPGDAEPQVLIAFAPAHWSYVYAASVIDGHAVAVAHWPEPATHGADDEIPAS